MLINKINLRKKFINYSKKKYNNAFDYSLIKKYVDEYTKVTLKCIKHNIIFDIIPFYHLNRMYGGCIKCLNKNSKIELKDELKDGEIIRYINLQDCHKYNIKYIVTNTGRVFDF